MEAVRTSETSVNLKVTTRRYNLYILNLINIIEIIIMLYARLILLPNLQMDGQANASLMYFRSIHFAAKTRRIICKTIIIYTERRG
jgi:hypothetical protein